MSAASILLIVGSPLLLGCALTIRVVMGPPILFRQLRPGKDEHPFEILKFRTMRVGDLPDNERRTRLGDFLRRTSLDELPQLINVIRGDMSFVGPRPLSIQYLPYYSDDERRRHSVRPGITGLAQVSGRNSISWDDKFSNDLAYIENLSFQTDLSILLRTLKKVLARTGVGYRGEGGVEDFDSYRRRQLMNGIEISGEDY